MKAHWKHSETLARILKRIFAISAFMLTTLVLLSEAAYLVNQHNESYSTKTGNCSVLVLGYPTEADGTPHPVQRFRVQAGVDAYREKRCSRIILSGGAVKNQYVEADTMAEIARSFGVPEKDIIIENTSRTTWENIGCSARYLENDSRVFLVSDTFHAQRAKRYSCRQNTALCPKMISAGTKPPFQLLWWSVPASIYELRARLRDFFIYEQGGTQNDPLCPIVIP